MKWLRLYTDVPDDPKVQRLSAQDFRTWINVLCVAGRDQEGFLPDDADMAYTLRLTVSQTRRALEMLYRSGLLDSVVSENGELRWRPHGWDTRQYKSDTSAERTRRHREKQRHGDVTVTADVTSQ